MPTEKERQYYRMGFNDGILFSKSGSSGYTPRPSMIEEVYSTTKPKSKRKPSGWNKFVKANSKKPRFRYKSGAKRGKLNLKALGVAYRKKKR